MNILYIDDLLAPTSSGAQVEAVMQGCEAFTREFGPQLNLGKTKTAIMGPVGANTSDLGAAKPQFMGDVVPVVDVCPYLGVWLDVALAFVIHVSSMLARGWHTFREFLGAANYLGLPTPSRLWRLRAEHRSYMG